VNKSLSIQSQKEFEQIFHSLYGELCSYANMFLKDLEAGEEIVQELFVKLWENRESVDIKSSVRSYLLRAVRNSCLNFLKHQKVEESYKQYNEEIRNESSFALDEEYVGSELELKIREVIDQLPPERKKIFLMSRFEGLKYREIADKSGISIKTVENQMGKAIKFLREELAEYTTLLILFSILLISDI
jgi:RNA polymerase sigma-70 factor (ECF subfamily)